MICLCFLFKCFCIFGWVLSSHTRPETCIRRVTEQTFAGILQLSQT